MHISVDFLFLFLLLLLFSVPPFLACSVLCCFAKWCQALMAPRLVARSVCLCQCANSPVSRQSRRMYPVGRLPCRVNSRWSLICSAGRHECICRKRVMLSRQANARLSQSWSLVQLPDQFLRFWRLCQCAKMGTCVVFVCSRVTSVMLCHVLCILLVTLLVVSTRVGRRRLLPRTFPDVSTD